MTFLHPAFLILLLALPLLWVFPKGERQLWHVLVRGAVLALLILGLARPVRLVREANPVHVFVLDASPSVTESARLFDELTSAAEALPASTEVHLVLAGGAPPEGEFERHFQSVRHLAPEGDASPIPAALSSAARSIPRGGSGSITLLSDGLASDEFAARALSSLSNRGIPIHTKILFRPGDDVFPVALEPVGRAPLLVGRTVRLNAEIIGPDESSSVIDVTLRGPNGQIAAQKEGVSVTGRTNLVLEFEPEAAGFQSVELEVQVQAGANRDLSNDTLQTTLAIDEPKRALYLGERMASGEDELQDLVGSTLALEAWDGAELTPQTLASYDLALLDDLPAASLGEASQEQLVTAVQNAGLGLFVSGGAGAFGPGGYHRQPLEEILPVEFVQKEEKRDPSTTLVVIIDTSGSMGGNRVQLAKEVARLSIRRLLPHDKVGIVEFYGAKHWAAPIQPASNAIELERALNRLDAGGGTVILPAIEEAFYGLKNVQTRYKHVLVLTDGGVESGAFEPLLRNMADEGINVSTVLIGPEAHSEFLVTLANWGKGRFYSVPNRFNLPEILLKQPASAKLPSYRPGSHAVQARGGAGWWGEVDPATAPSLAGYVETRDRPGAEVLLETAEGSHPLLGSWRHGLGRVTAFLSEPTGPGTEPWSEWPGFSPFLTRVLERTASDQRSAYSYRLEREGSALVLTAKRLRAGVDAPRAQRLAGEEGNMTELALWERAPGLFESRFAAPRTEEVRVLCQDPSAALQTRLVSNANADLHPENRIDPASRLNLAALREATGGQSLDEVDSLSAYLPQAGVAEAPASVQRLWPTFVLAALLLYLLEIALRRREGRVAAPIQ